jgi:hypothetical protein
VRIRYILPKGNTVQKFAFILILAFFSAVAHTSSKYENINDPKLEIDAKADLHKKYPALNDNDIELLWGYKAVDLYYKDRGERAYYEM